MEERILEIVLKARDEASKEIQNVGKEAGGLANLLAGSFKNAAILSGAALAGLAVEAVRSVGAFEESQAAVSQLEAVLHSTGGVAGVTKDAAIALASSLEKVTSYSDEAVIGAENLLLTFTNIGKNQFPQATQTVLDMSTALGQDLKSSAIQLGKALQDPILGVTALRRVGVNFNEQQQEVIKNLVASGHQLDAQKMILKELQTEFGGSAEAAGKTFGGSVARLKNQINNLEESLGKMIVNALQPFIEKAANVATVLVDFFNGAKSLDDVTKSLKENFGGFGEVLGNIIVFFATHREAVIALAGAIGGFLAIALIAAGVAMASFIGLSLPVIGIAMLIGAAAALLIANWGGISGFFTNLWNSIVAKFNEAKQFIIDVLTAIWTVVGPILQSIFDTFSTIFNAIWAVVSYVFNFIWTLIQFYFYIYLAEIQLVLGLIQAIWNAIWGAIGPYVTTIWEGIKNIISGAINGVKTIISSVLTAISQIWENSWKEKYETVVSWFTKIHNYISDAVNKVKGFFQDLANSITKILTNIHIPTLHIETETKEIMGQKVQVPKLGWYEQGGFVPETMLAVLHKGEFVLSKDMLAGNQAAPIPGNSYNNPISIGPVYVSDSGDVDTLAQRLAFFMQTSGNL
jgi:hypothetical protein